MPTLTTSYQLMSETYLGSNNYGGVYLRLYGKYNSQDYSANTTNVSFKSTIYIERGYMYTGGTTTKSISGDGISSRSGNAEGTYQTGETTIYEESGNTTHANDGTKQVSATTTFYSSPWGFNGSASATWDCPTIPRYAYFSVQPQYAARTETTLDVYYKPDRNITAVQYRIKEVNGSYGSWSNINVISGEWNTTAGCTFRISGLTANKNYVVQMQIQNVNVNWTLSNEVSTNMYTYPYPYCTEAPNFTIGDNVTINLFNPLNRTVQIQMWSGVSQQFVSNLITVTGTSYTGFSDIANNLYASIPNNTSSNYNIDVWYSGNKAIKEGGNYYIRGNETPTFNNFTYEDTNSDIINLTGNNQVLVDNFSTCKFNISTRAVAKNGATIDGYICYYGDNYITYLEQDMSNYWQKQFDERFTLSFDNNTNINTITCAGAGGWECLYFPIKTIVDKTYTFTFDYKNPNGYTPLSGQNGIPCQILNKVENNDNTRNQIATITLNPTASQDTQHLSLTFTATSNITYITFNFGYAADFTTTTIYLGNFKLNDITGTGNILKIQAIDSRGLSTTVTKTITNIPYVSPFINNISTQRHDGVDSKTYLAGKFTIYNGSWDASNDANSMNRLKYVGYSVYINGAWSNYYDITSEILNAATETVVDNNKVYEFDYNDEIQIHANGSSGGFAIGTEYQIRVLIKDGDNSYVFTPTTYQALATANVTDGVVATCLHKDSNNLYHFGFNCMSDNNYMLIANDVPLLDNNGVLILGDALKLVSYRYGQSLTLNAHSSAELFISAPTIQGYTFLACLGGAGEGLTGLLVSATVGYLNDWVYNCRDTQGTWSDVEFVLLYVKSS